MAYVVDERPVVAVATDEPGMKWSAIFAGWVVATGVAALLYLGGLAMGFSAFDAHEAGGNLKGIGIGSLLWLVLTWAVAMLLGGMFASWFDGRTDQTSGTLHGVTVWGLALTATVAWLGLGLGHAMHGGGPGPRGPAPMGAAAMAGADTGAVAVLHARVARLVDADGRRGMGGRDGADAIVAALLTRNDRTANDLLEASTTLPAEQASADLQALSPQITAARNEAKAAADRAAHRAAMLLWSAFASVLVGLLAAALGGWLGAGHVHRVYHLRSYPDRPLRRVP